MQIDIGTWTNEILNVILSGCLVLWAIARTFEVWLKVHKQVSTLMKEKRENATIKK